MWAEVQLTRAAIRARGTILFYTVLLTIPYVILSAGAAWLAGLSCYEIVGVACFLAMVTSLFMFDTLRNAAHTCFAKAWDAGLVALRDGIPEVSHDCPHHRLARLSFALGSPSLAP